MAPVTDLATDVLCTELTRRVRGEVRFDAGARALYASGGSNYRQVPIGVVFPRDADDVMAAVGVCHDYGVPVLPIGADTSLAGQSTNVAVILDFPRHMHRLLELDVEGRRARVQPGLILDHLRDAAEHHHLTFGPDPSTHAYCTLGGMIGNNSCGVHSVMAGTTSNNVETLDILTYDGLRMTVGATSDDELEAIVAGGDRRAAIYRRLRDLRDRYADTIRERFPDIPRRVSGYNLDQLLPENGFNVARALVGTEGTCVTVLEATVRLVPSPPARSLLVLGFRDVYTAADHAPEVLATGPIGLEGLDDRLIEDMHRKHMHSDDLRLLPDGRGWLLAEFGGETKEEADAAAERCMRKLGRTKDAPEMKLFDDPEAERHVWEVREAGLGATAIVPGDPRTHEGWEDSAVPPERLGDYLRDLRAMFDRYGYGCALYGHFGEGCVHTRIDFDLRTAGGIATYHDFIEEAADLVVSYGGSLSGEHGDGQARAELLPKMFGKELVDAFREFKSIWDPAGHMNPHKVVDPYRADENLKLGPNYRPIPVKTTFKFPHDGGDFATATLRCVGVGKCRRTETEGGTMCPSFLVTGQEEHTTRGRAHLLFEMMRGEVVDQGWRDDRVKEALDLCLACKGCKGDCPVNVDMATYKAEFLSHYFKRRLRPRSAYAMGLIYWAARAASHAPALANAATHWPGVSALAKRAAGLAPERDIPRFARTTFRARFAARRAKTGVAPGDRSRVLLWPDTFTNHFEPDVAEAAVRVLEGAGFQVDIPTRPLCCGRPLYDFGMLNLAKRQLRQIIDTLRDDITAGTPIVGLEPSCVAVFRDELGNLFPHDPDADRLAAQTVTLSEFLSQHDPDRFRNQLTGTAMVQAHCHHRAVMGFDVEAELLRTTGLDVDVLDSGCCGMAGSFGFEAGDHYDVAMKAGERVVLPAVRDAAPDTLVVADGFSCREQIRQGTGRTPLHLAQVLDRARP
ncbi:MAG: FAD-binding oxidoreductase [Actinobacteria bacterium]|nr:FAD-binding oxidoreductase [Actinomycetota bacterium]